MPEVPTQDVVPRKAILEAEAELLAAGPIAVAAEGVTFVALVRDWLSLEQQRETVRVRYLRARELQGRGHKVESDPFLAAYVQLKEEQELVETQLRDLFHDVSERQTQEWLQGTHYAADTGAVLRVPERLSQLLVSPTKA
jgi:hypothetical protein